MLQRIKDKYNEVAATLNYVRLTASMHYRYQIIYMHAVSRAVNTLIFLEWIRATSVNIASTIINFILAVLNPFNWFRAARSCLNTVLEKVGLREPAPVELPKSTVAEFMENNPNATTAAVAAAVAGTFLGFMALNRSVKLRELATSAYDKAARCFVTSTRPGF